MNDINTQDLTEQQTYDSFFGMSQFDRNEVALRILCAYISATGSGLVRSLIESSFEYADLFIQKSKEQ